jgi:hypothetical protein
MRCFRALGGIMYSSALLLPFAAAADSQLQTGSRGPLNASAHVRFRVIIPTMLSLDTATSARATGTQTVAIMSNSRNVALTATIGTSGDAKGRLILSAAARKIIAQDAPCTLGPPQIVAGLAATGDAATQRVICTVSMP